MSDWGRIHRKLHQHPKARAAGLEAIGLWTICNSWARDKRSSGFVPDSVVEQFAGSLKVAADRLVEVGLWLRVEGGYRFKDWDQWNADESPQNAAMRIIRSVIPAGHPTEILNRLCTEVQQLLADGIEYDVVVAALKLWLSKDTAPPSWLPMLVSDVVRRGSGGDRDVALRDAYRTGNTEPLHRWGLYFCQPDIPLDLKTTDAVRAFVLNAKREWIRKVR